MCECFLCLYLSSYAYRLSNDSGPLRGFIAKSNNEDFELSHDASVAFLSFWGVVNVSNFDSPLSFSLIFL